VRFIQDAVEQVWSVNTLCNKLKTFVEQPEGRVALSFGPAGHHTIDRFMQRQQAFIMPESLLDILDLTPEEFYSLLHHRLQHRLIYIPLKELEKTIKSTTHLIPEKDQKPTEKRQLKALESLEWHITHAIRHLTGAEYKDVPRRTLRVGISDSARGWTDGGTYIAFARHVLEQAGVSPKGFDDLTKLLIHEYCHASPDTGTHDHDLEFYRLFHDVTAFHSPGWADSAYQHYVKQIEQAAGKISVQEEKRRQKTTFHQEAEDRVRTHEELVHATTPLPNSKPEPAALPASATQP